MPTPKSFAELRQAARNDPERARRIDAAKQRAIDEIASMMSDNPTLWKWEHWPDCGHQGCSDALRDTVVSQGMVPASRADLLAALDVDWYCMYGHDEDCVSDPHDGCHWAVKP